MQITANDVAENIAALAPLLEDEGVRRISSAVSRSNGAAIEEAPPARTLATHLLADHHAFALDHARFGGLFDPASATCREAGVVINGATAAAGQPLAPGDEVSCLGEVFTAIRLE